MRYKEYIPASIRYSLTDAPLWGRLVKIGPESCLLLSRYDFRKYAKLYLTFEFNGKKIEDFPWKIIRMEKDDDGYYFYTCLTAGGGNFPVSRWAK